MELLPVVPEVPQLPAPSDTLLAELEGLKKAIEAEKREKERIDREKSELQKTFDTAVREHGKALEAAEKSGREKLAALEKVSAERLEAVRVEMAKATLDPAKLDAVAIRVISVLQAEGRLLDFLSEDIKAYSDADVGAAVREVHRGLKQALADHFPVAPVRSEEEESPVTVPAGFDPSEIRLVGNLVGSPPFSGTLKHRGWRVTKVNLPKVPEGKAATIAAPAEVEV
jgi:hypothetical protein